MAASMIDLVEEICGTRALPARAKEAPLVIRLDSISKQHGRQILFLEASAARQPRREGRPGRSERLRQVHHLPHDHSRGRARRRAGRRSIAA